MGWIVWWLSDRDGFGTQLRYVRCRRRPAWSPRLVGFRWRVRQGRARSRSSVETGFPVIAECERDAVEVARPAHSGRRRPQRGLLADCRPPAALTHAERARRRTHLPRRDSRFLDVQELGQSIRGHRGVFWEGDWKVSRATRRDHSRKIAPSIIPRSRQQSKMRAL